VLDLNGSWWGFAVIKRIPIEAGNWFSKGFLEKGRVELGLGCRGDGLFGEAGAGCWNWDFVEKNKGPLALGGLRGLKIF
jgi:hypothetical protein